MTGINSIEALHYETGEPVKIEISDGLIRSITNIAGLPENSPGLIVAPGLIDNQVNGYMGVDFSEDGVNVQSMMRVLDAIHKDGVTSFVPTIITNSHEKLIRNFRNVCSVLKEERINDSIPGFHLEGPYISPERGYYGTHPVEFVRKPSWDEFLNYQEAAEGRIIEVTVAPEVDGVMEFITKCSKNSILVSIGHSNASAEQINEAVERGARLATHLGNGLANMIDRHKNPIWPLLANELIMPSIIADGNHLLREQVWVFCKIKGPENIFLVSDVSPLIGMAPGHYNYLGSEVLYTADGYLRNLKMNCLAGASLPLKRGVENIVDFTDCSLATAINMATRNVSKACKLTDRGHLIPGERADLILFKFENRKIFISQTMVKGRIVFSDETKFYN
jgi:N-acetylglucosamine-6-phosphate deacetylase